MKRNFLLFCILFLLFYLFLEPGNALLASRQGLGLWMNTLIPTLLPFLILSNLLIHTGIIERLLSPLAGFWRFAFGLSPYGAYAFVLGMLCGYPMGAKLTGDLYGAGKLTRREAHYLLTFCNSASPMFLTTYLVHQTLHRPDYLLPTFGIVYSCNYLCSLCFRLYYRPYARRNSVALCSTGAAVPKDAKKAPAQSSEENWMDASILNGFETITRLGGYILLFSIFSAALKNLWHQDSILRDIFLLLTEISTGLYYMKDTALSFPLQYALTLSATSFGGLCILMQTKSVLTEKGLPLSPYLAGKTVNLVLTFGMALVVAQIIQ